MDSSDPQQRWMMAQGISTTLQKGIHALPPSVSQNKMALSRLLLSARQAIESSTVPFHHASPTLSSTMDIASTPLGSVTVQKNPSPMPQPVSTSAADEEAPQEQEAETQQVLPKPKRCLTAYNLFFQHERQKILQSLPKKQDQDAAPKKPNWRTKKGIQPHGKIGFADLAKQISGRWKVTGQIERNYFLDLAKQDRQRYDREMAAWKQSQRDDKKKKKTTGGKKSKTTSKASLSWPSRGTTASPNLLADRGNIGLMPAEQPNGLMSGTFQRQPSMTNSSNCGSACLGSSSPLLLDTAMPLPPLLPLVGGTNQHQRQQQPQQQEGISASQLPRNVSVDSTLGSEAPLGRKSEPATKQQELDEDGLLEPLHRFSSFNTDCLPTDNLAPLSSSQCNDGSQSLNPAGLSLALLGSQLQDIDRLFDDDDLLETLVPTPMPPAPPQTGHHDHEQQYPRMTHLASQMGQDCTNLFLDTMNKQE